AFQIRPRRGGRFRNPDGRVASLPPVAAKQRPPGSGYPMNDCLPSPSTNASLQLASLYAAHADDVRRWVPRIAGPSVDAEDIVHEVFIVVQRRLHEFRGDAKFTTWLYRITAFVALRQLRKQRVRGALHGVPNEMADEVASLEPSPCEQLEE